MADREVLLVLHTGRPAALGAARIVAAHLAYAGVGLRMLAEEDAEVTCGAHVTPPEVAAHGAEVVLVIGGDGTLLRAAELARPAAVPVLGINLGRVGFLAEVDRADLLSTVERVVAGAYEVQERMTVDVAVFRDGRQVASSWALNECSVEKAARERMLDVIVEIDGRPLSRWGGDGVVCATPTGSTAYAFSAGGPVVWPEVEALLVVPISAHALFARPLVVSPTSVLAVEVLAETAGDAVMWCDGRRTVPLPVGARVEVRRGALPVRLARLQGGAFTDRLVSKFRLPVHGWRGGAERA